jgi:predicted glycosyltransferase
VSATTLYYALGGGLGHLARARKVIAALGLRDVALLTASRFACDPRVTGGLPLVLVPPSLGRNRPRFVAWLRDLLREFDSVVVDSFPGGILGELCELSLPRATLISRLLRWEVYEQRLSGPLPEFEAVYAVEPGVPGQFLALPRSQAGEPLVDEPHWLVVHSGPRVEVERLVALAAGAPRLLVIGPHGRFHFPIEPHLGHAERIVTGAGFNLMHEAAPFRDRHVFVPFARALDFQFARAAAARS